MRIKEGLLPPEPHIRRNLKGFKYGGFQKRFTGLPCITIKLDWRHDAVTITFIDPMSNKKISYTMDKSEIEYI